MIECTVTRYVCGNLYQKVMFLPPKPMIGDAIRLIGIGGEPAQITSVVVCENQEDLEVFLKPFDYGDISLETYRSKSSKMRETYYSNGWAVVDG